MSDSATAPPEVAGRQWNVNPEEMEAALDETDRALRRLLRAIRKNEGTERALKAANRQVHANRALRDGSTNGGDPAADDS